MHLSILVICCVFIILYIARHNWTECVFSCMKYQSSESREVVMSVRMWLFQSMVISIYNNYAVGCWVRGSSYLIKANHYSNSVLHTDRACSQSVSN